MLKQKRGAAEMDWITVAVISLVFLLIVLGGIWYVSSSGGKVLAEVNREDLDTKISLGCTPAYKEGGFDAKISFCQKFDPIGGSLLFGSNNFISCQYRPVVEIMLQNGDIDAADLAGAAQRINSFCATDLIIGAKDGDELAFATKFCSTEKARANNFKDGLWVNGFIFDKECKVTKYPDWYSAPQGTLSDFITSTGRVSIEAFTNGGKYKLAGVEGVITGNSQASTFVPSNGSNGVDITQENIVRLQAVDDSKMPSA